MDPELMIKELEDLSTPRTSFTIFEEYSSNRSSLRVANATENNINIYYFYDWAQFTVMWVLFVSIVLLNASVIAALLCTNARKSRMNFFIMQLAIADLFVGLVYVFPDIVQKITIAWLAGEFMCKLVKFLQAVVMYASTYVLVALSIDRCDAITNPMNFSGSWNRARGLIVSAWLISIVFSIPLLILYEIKEVQGQQQCWIDLGTPKRWQIWMTLVSIMIFVFPALAIAACYAVIVMTIWTKSKAVVMSPPVNSRRTKTMRNGHVEGDPDSRRASSRGLIPRAKIKSVKMTFVIVFVFVLCWSPYIVFDLLQVYNYIPATQTSMAVATLIQSLAPLNSAANPLICCMFSPHIYMSLRRVPPYRWLWCRRRRHARGTLRSRSDSTAHSDLLSNSAHGRREHSVALSLNRTRSSSVSRAHERRTQLLVLSAVRD
ncbi:cardioacceleratory peptide receptor-like [Choristoneura fumiferana]|uniref:cardioacceleratory peptide receptor-like n=1 Tax=Choristoneura fumiferana TaxID=7141 RepID=UPI003D1590C6